MSSHWWAPVCLLSTMRARLGHGLDPVGHGIPQVGASQDRRTEVEMASGRGWGKIRRLPSGRLQASFVGPDLQRHTASQTEIAEHREFRDDWQA